MSGHSPTGWAIMLADLALILFIVSANQAGSPAVPVEVDAPSVPQAIFEASDDAPPFADWLKDQELGQGAIMEITIDYNHGRFDEAYGSARDLLKEADAAGLRPRVVFAEGEPSTRVVMTYGDN
ncbi:hypothetical protein [Croceicoccus gelatinilyticus]|uniref:hypothetical protein n=1 Tax=Croceicoccus gelatinilyticus TaxID=2835536 RepID=UPI001BD03B48|nr:hypothetical protein [Croceicoccus gelatinilyticus]MBS7671310.1 hypothetical protein [Croceicoccus gelatinilyticus]